jgi:hypothetical protein
MNNLKGTSFDDRLSTAANAKKAELEKFRARSGTTDPAFAERQAARHAISVARDARTAERNVSRLASVAQEAAEKVARDAPWKPSKLPPMPRSLGTPPMTSPCKPNARRPVMPAMPLARRGLENDSHPPSKFGDRPAMQRSMCRSREPALAYTL